MTGTESTEAILKGFNLISDIQVYWNICEEQYLRSEHREKYKVLIGPLANLYSHIIEFQARVICHLSRQQLSRAWQNVAGWNDWNGKSKEIGSLSQHCCRCIEPLDAKCFQDDRDSQLQKMQESSNILTEIRMILDAGSKETKRIYEDQTERDLLQILESNYEDSKNFNPRKVDGTCEWFFMDEKFQRWRNSDTCNLLWVSAGPGCGKSVLSRALIDEKRLSTKVTTSTVCYFFFKDSHQGRMQATDALSAILHQIFTNSLIGGLIKHALPSHKNYGNGLSQNFSALWQILMDCANSPDAGDIICVIDALDECNTESREQLIAKLNEFYYQPKSSCHGLSKLKFLITSRPYDDIEVSFESFSATAEYLRFDGDEKSAQIGKEINLVIDAKLKEITGKFNNDDRKRIADRLKGMENRTYLWLYLIIDIIKKSPSQFGKRSDVEMLLSKTTAEVSDVYEEILGRSKDQKQTKTLLQIVLSAVRPLTLDEVNVALTLALGKGQFDSHTALMSERWPENGFGSVVKNLGGLFITVHDSRLSFIHQTAREFLTDNQQKGKWQGRLKISKAQCKMSRICLEYLSYIDVRSGPIEQFRLEFPLAQYSARYWVDHARSVEAETKVQKCILYFFLEQKQAYKAWGSLFDPDYPYYGKPDHMKMSTPLYYASLLGLQCTVESLLQKGADVNAQGGYYDSALQAASGEGHQEIVQLLLERGADINAQGGAWDSALKAASGEGHQEIVQLLLERGADINTLGGAWGSALQAACRQGHQGIVQLLLERGADVNVLGGEWGSALQAASGKGYQEIIQLLLERGADINTQGGVWGSALQVASIGGYQEIVQLLLERGADINTQKGNYGSALQAASIGGHQEIVQLLLERGADINAQKGNYGSALQAASGEGHQEIVQLLLERGADINAQKGNDGSALQAASIRGSQEIVQLLLERGADVNTQGENYGSALQAASIGGSQEIVQLLLERGADINAQGGAWGSALQVASRRGSQGIVQLLLERGADVNTQGENYGSALQAASIGGYQEIIQLLLERGADINAQGGNYGSALQAASIGGSQEIVQLLLERGADVNAQGGYYDSALQAASGEGYQEIVQLLLERGADINTQGGAWGSALQVASRQGHQGIVQLLRERGARE